MSWIEKFQGLSSLSNIEKELLEAKSSVVKMRRNTVVFGPGETPDHLLLLLEGTVRVQQLSDKGREIVLYRVRAGESCVMTSACMLAFESYSAQGIAETDALAAAIPMTIFDQLVSDSVDFRQFIFTAYSTRMVELFQVVEDVAFQRVDIRLAEKILELAQGNVTVNLTHQQLGAELGTAREVISRQLLEFQRRHWVSQSRGAIRILNFAGLKKLANT